MAGIIAGSTGANPFGNVMDRVSQAAKAQAASNAGQAGQMAGDVIVQGAQRVQEGASGSGDLEGRVAALEGAAGSAGGGGVAGAAGSAGGGEVAGVAGMSDASLRAARGMFGNIGMRQSSIGRGFFR